MKNSVEPTPNEEFKLKKYQLWLSIIDVFLKSFIVLLGVYLGVQQFNKQQLQSKNLEFNRNLWSKELDIYQKSCSVVGGLASNFSLNYRNKSEYEKYKQEFYKLYWGDLGFLTDTIVVNESQFLRHELEMFDLKMNYDISNFNALDTNHIKFLEILRVEQESFVRACHQESARRLKNLINE
jgi:hypothetical protein